MATNERQGLEAALADVNDLIRRVQSQIASTQNSNNFTAAEKAPRLATLQAELAGYQAQQSALTQQLNQLGPNNASDGAVAASGPTPVAPGPGTTGTTVAAAAPPNAGAAVYDPNTVYKTEVNGVGNTPNRITKEDPVAPVFRVEVNGAGPKIILPTPNVLDKFSSYTYQASVYLLTPTQYVNFQDGNRIIPNSQLLFQSGGKAPGTGNKFFDNDFYIDNITIETLMAGKQTQGAHMATDIKFTVTEPTGITLLDRLKNAVKAQRPAGDKSNWAAAHYLMVISFFGYDQTGNLVTPGNTATNTGTQNSKAVVVKYIPFLIKGVNWSVGNKLVSYEFTGAPVGQLTGGSSKSGTISSDFQITAGTVGEFFGGRSITSAGPAGAPADSPGQSTTPFKSTGGGGANAPETAVAAPTSSAGGLVEALNANAVRAAKQAGWQQPDTYDIVFVNAEEIKSAALGALETFKNKKIVPMSQPANLSPGSLDPSKTPASTTRYTIPITAGMPIIKMLDLVIRDSQYITKKQITKNDSDGGIGASSNNTDPPTWYLITFSARPIGDAIDPIRNDYAYNMRYTITKYAVPNLHSTRFPVLKTFPGLHKEYKYWFTGENKAILDFSARFDSMYQMTTNGTGDSSALDAQQRILSASKNDLYRDEVYLLKTGYAPRSTQPVGLGSNNVNEGSANAAEYLYSPEMLGSSKIRILGDPAWIQQGSLVSPIGINGFSQEADLGFLPDGTISFDTVQALYEIAWQRPEDYDISTGLADPYAKTFQKYGEREPLQSNIYQATKVVHEFRNGQFEQTIEGLICLFNKPKQIVTAAQYSAADSSRVAIGESPSERTQPATASSSNRFTTNTNTAAAPAAAASVVSAAALSTGTTPAPAQLSAVAGSNVPATTAEQYAAIDNARGPITEVQNVVPSLPPTAVTSNGQTVGGYGFGTVLNSPPVLVPGAGRTSLDALQSAAVNIPPYLTRRDP
jgi:hypothetical protein